MSEPLNHSTSGGEVTSRAEKGPRRWLPALVGLTFQLCNVAVAIVGLMALSENRVEWHSYFDRTVEAYRSAVSLPVARAIEQLALRFGLDLSWIPWWLPDYLPIASVFTLGLIASFAHLERTTPLHLAWEIVRDAIRGLREDFDGTIGGILIAVPLAVLFALTSPAFVIVFPALLVVWFLASVAFVLMLIYGLVRLVVVYVLPLLLLLAVVVGSVWRLRAREGFMTWVATCRKNISEWIRKLLRATPEKLARVRCEIRKTVPKARSDMGASLRFYARLVAMQYAVAAAVLVLFLTLVALNNALAG